MSYDVDMSTSPMIDMLATEMKTYSVIIDMMYCFFLVICIASPLYDSN